MKVYKLLKSFETKSILYFYIKTKNLCFIEKTERYVDENKALVLIKLYEMLFNYDLALDR